MIIRQQININALPEKVWKFIADPNRVMQWNPKLKRVEKVSISPVGLNYRYEALYEMNKKQNVLSCEMVQFEKPAYLKIEYREKNMSDPAGQNRSVTEEYFSKPEGSGSGTFLEQVVTIRDSSIPLWARMLIKWIMSFGKPVGQTYLEKLKQLVEAP